MKTKSVKQTWKFSIRAVLLVMLAIAFFCGISEARDFDHIKWVVMSDCYYGYRVSDYQDLKEIGVDAIEDGISWAEVESSYGSFDFSKARESYERCTEAGLIWIPHLSTHYKPDWMGSEFGFYLSDGTSVGDQAPPNYFNPMTQYYVERFIQAFADAFSDVDIPLIYISSGQYGESYYPGIDERIAAFDSYTIAAWREYTGNSSAMPYSSHQEGTGTGGTLEEFLDWWYQKMYEYITYNSEKIGECFPNAKIGLKASYYPAYGQNADEQIGAVPASLRGVVSFGGPLSQISGLEGVGIAAAEYDINYWVESFLRDYNGYPNSIELSMARLAVNSASAMMYATILDLISADWPPPAFVKKDEFYTFAELIDSYDSYKNGFMTWYFAEGCTLGDFSEWVAIQNPTLQSANVKVTFMVGDQLSRSNRVMYYTVPACSRYTVSGNSNVIDSFSVKVESTNNVMIVPERMMYFGESGGHASIGVNSPKNTWYMAEGFTGNGFREWILIQNPSDVSARVKITFMRPNFLPPVEIEKNIPANSRDTTDVYTILPNESSSAKIELMDGGDGIVAERSMYWPFNGIDRYEGHNNAAVSEPSTTWYLAEGATFGGFDEWILIQNPNQALAHVRITFLRSNSLPPIEIEKYVSDNSRDTTRVYDYVPNESVAAKVESLDDGNGAVPIIVERSMYLNGAGHNSAGSPSTGVMWFLAEGCTKSPYDEYVVILNPNSADASIKMTCMLPGGIVYKFDYTIPGNSRYTIHVDELIFLEDADVSIKIESINGVGIVVERAMYWNGGAHCSLGAK